jgi:hypothetical protein
MREKHRDKWKIVQETQADWVKMPLLCPVAMLLSARHAGQLDEAEQPADAVGQYVPGRVPALTAFPGFRLLAPLRGATLCLSGAEV